MTAFPSRSCLLIGIGLLLLSTGCAPAYHAYRCGSVSYAYCPPAPLPYTTYCGCPTPVAACYAAQAGSPTNSATSASELSLDSRPD